MAKCKTCRKEGAKKRNSVGLCLCKECWNKLSKDEQNDLAMIGVKIEDEEDEYGELEPEEPEYEDDELFEDEEVE